MRNLPHMFALRFITFAERPLHPSGVDCSNSAVQLNLDIAAIKQSV